MVRLSKRKLALSCKSKLPFPRSSYQQALNLVPSCLHLFELGLVVGLRYIQSYSHDMKVKKVHKTTYLSMGVIIADKTRKSCKV